MDNQAIHVYNEFSIGVDNLFSGCLKAMYAYGSAVYDDLHIGYSDLDFFAVLSCEITQEHFDALLAYRKKLKESENMLFGMLEGEFVPESLLAARKGGNVAYWGTTGEWMKDGYDLVGFSMRSLLKTAYWSMERMSVPHSPALPTMKCLDRLNISSKLFGHTPQPRMKTSIRRIGFF